MFYLYHSRCTRGGGLAPIALPFSGEIIDRNAQSGCHPSCGEDECHIIYGIEYLHGNVQEQQANGEHVEQRDAHDRGRFSCAADGAGENFDKYINKVQRKQAHDNFAAQINDRRIAGKQTHDNMRTRCE